MAEFGRCKGCGLEYGDPAQPLETSIEQDAAVVRAACTVPGRNAIASDALDRILARVKLLEFAEPKEYANAKRLELELSHYENLYEKHVPRIEQLEGELTLEKQRGEAYTAALKRILSLPPPMADDGGVGWEEWVNELEAIAREALGEETHVTEQQKVARAEIPHDLFEAQRENTHLRSLVQHLTEDNRHYEITIQRFRETLVDKEDIAREFHDAYEHLAPEFGYETRKESAVPWEDVPEPNKSLMLAVAQRVGGHIERRSRRDGS